MAFNLNSPAAKFLSTSFTEKITEKLGEKFPEKFGTASRGPVVAMVRLHGVITPMAPPVGRPTISAQNVEEPLKRAFNLDRVQAVALSINSPGGAATQSALIAERIRELAAEKNVPVFTFCEDVAASGGYWLACAADEVYAHSTSLIGSVGVISASFGFNGLLERIGVERRVYAAGENKVRLDPFQPEKDSDVAWLRGLQDDTHEQFIEWVRTRRGEKLQEPTSDEEGIFSGEVWSGRRAAELGLVDGVGTLREVMTQRFPEAKIVPVSARKPLLGRLGLGSAPPGGASAAALLSSVEALEQKACWSRFGL